MTNKVKITQLESQIDALTASHIHCGEGLTILLDRLEDRLVIGEKELNLLRFQFTDLCKTMAKAFTSPAGLNLYDQLRALESRLEAIERKP
jgi:hypothetical protein